MLVRIKLFLIIIVLLISFSLQSKKKVSNPELGM